MEAKTLDWSLCRSFLAVVREGSLSAAARSLGLTQPTVGRHISALESKLETPLFTRSQHGLRPTEIALGLVPHAEAMASASAAFVRSASCGAGEDQGTVRVTASEIIGAEVLPPMLASFRERYPKISIELALSNKTEDLLKREADIAVRMVRPQQTGLIARHLGQVPISLYVHRSYAERHKVPRTAEELLRHPIIGYDAIPSALSAVRMADIAVTQELFHFRSDSDLAQLAMLRAGCGIGACQNPLALQDEDLLPVLHDLIRFEIPMWLAMHENLKASRPVRLLLDHLAAGLSAYLRGPSPIPAFTSAYATLENKCCDHKDHN
jgi:DNA-binding transcriptional LysR family regulator